MGDSQAIPRGWQNKRFRDVAQINPPIDRDLNPDTKVSFVPMTDVSEQAKIVGDQVRSYHEVAKGYTAFQNGDILVAKITPCFENGKGALAQNLVSGVGFGSTEFHVIRAKSSKVSSEFLYFLTLSETFRGYGESNRQGSAGQKRIPTDFIRSYRFLCPTLPEQRRIAEILSTWDAAIDLIEQRLAAAEQRKKALMQRLLTGRVRFPEFAGEEWREVQLKNIAKVIMGQSPRSANYNEEGNGLPLVQGNADITNRKTAPQVYTTQITKQCEKGDVILSVRAPVGDIALSIHNACIGRGVCAIRAQKADAEFLYQILIFVEPQWDRYAQGSIFKAINSKDIRSFTLKVPQSLLEQRRIAAVLQTCDREIELLTRKHDALQRQKKGLMQRLLTGRVRV